MSFKLDNQIAQDSLWLHNSVLSNIYIKNDCQFFWLILVPRVEHCQEIFQLTAQEQLLLMQEISELSKITATYCKADKINIGALGNKVSQLHVHVVARYHSDIAWPHSVWQPGMISKPYERAAQDPLLALWRTRIRKNQFFNSGD